MSTRCRWILALMIAFASAIDAQAAEDGVIRYLPGLFDLGAGIVPPPGSYLKNYSIYANLSDSREVGERELRINASCTVLVEAVSYLRVTPRRVFGANWAWLVFVPAARIDLRATVDDPQSSRRIDNTKTGLIDVKVIPFMAGWNRGNQHLSASAVAYVPIGSYDMNDPPNPGSNHWAVEANVGYTWLDPDSGVEMSSMVGYTVSLMNGATNYTSGDEFHIDFAFAKHFRSGLAAGLVGFYVQQTTADTGSGALFGSNKDFALALGPLVSWNGRAGGKPLAFTAKYYVSIDDTNCMNGDWLWFNVAMPL